MMKTYLLDELDKNLAIVGAVFSLILTIWLKVVIDRPVYVMVGLLCFIVCTGYLIIRKRIPQSVIPSLEELNCSTRFYITLNIFFFILFSYSIIIIYLRPEPYVRPLGYFIATALMAVIVANEILFLSPKKPQVWFTLCKIIIIGLSLQYSQTLIFPSIVGIDPWFHQWFTLKILENGYVSDTIGYSKMPLMHLMITITSLITDLGYKMATMFSISTIQVISDALFVFLLGKLIINNKVGLLATLLLETSNQHTRFGYWTMPNTMGAIFILPIIFIFLKMKRDKPLIGNIFLMFLMGPLILTHTISALCLSILLFVFWLSSLIYMKLFHEEFDLSVTLTICVLYTTMMLAYWSFISGDFLTLFNLVKIGAVNPLWIKNFNDFNYIPVMEQIFNQLGMFLFFSLSFIGVFYIMSKPFRNSDRVIIIIGGLVMLGLGFFSLISNITIIAHRWYYFSQILLAIPLSLSLFLINGIFKHRIKKRFLISIFVFIIVFLQIMSPESNIDNRIFSENSGSRLALTDSELQAGNTISTIYNGRVGTDKYYNHLFRYQLETKYEYIDNSLETGDFRILTDIMILIRKEAVNHPTPRRYKSHLSINYNPFLKLEKQNFSRIYDCGSVSGYLKP